MNKRLAKMQQKGFFQRKERRHKEGWDTRDAECGMKREQEEGPDK
jgi:hypothetical protein